MAVLAPLENTQTLQAQKPTPITQSRKLILPLGRGAHGKSLWSRWLIQQVLDRKIQIAIADADLINPSLEPYFDRVLTPPINTMPSHLDHWFVQILDTFIVQDGHMLIDFNGGPFPFEDSGEQLDLGPILVGHEIDLIAVHFIAPDISDLIYLDYYTKLLKPTVTILVLNAFFVPLGQPVDLAFKSIIQHRNFENAIEAGAYRTIMPRLTSHHGGQSGLLVNLDRKQDRLLEPTPVETFIASTWDTKMDANFEPLLASMTL